MVGSFAIVCRLMAGTGSLQRPQRHWLLPALLAFAAGVHAAALSTIDPDAHYPESPVWQAGQLYYVEYSTGNIRRWDGARVTTFWHRDGCGPSGLIEFHGHWLVACYDDNTLTEVDAAGKQLQMHRADSRHRAFKGPNDFAGDGHGGIYFSASGVYDIKAPISGAVLHLAADGKSITEVASAVHYPNGLALAADGQHLLVSEMLAGRVLSFTIEAGGRLGSRSVWARLQDLAPPTPGEDAYNGPDGLKLGPDGNYYIAQNGSGRVLVVGEDRKLIRTIEVPVRFVTNLGFGAPGTGAVFVTAVADEWHAPYAGGVYRWQP